MPSAPSATDRTAAASVTIENTTSAVSATARGVAAHRMPPSISGSALSLLRWGARDSGTAGQTAANACFCCITAVPPIVPSSPICPGRSRRIHSLLTFPAFAARCVGGTARGRIRGGHGQLLVERSRTQRRTQPGAVGASEVAVAHAEVRIRVHCTILEDAPFWHKSCNIVKSSFRQTVGSFWSCSVAM
jgi:hypothetical protein